MELDLAWLMGLAPVWVLVIALAGIAVLIVLASFQVIETRKLRLELVKPSLSLQPEYPIEEFSSLHLVNSGGIAKDVKINVSYDGADPDSLLINSIGTNCWVPVLSNFDELRQKGSRIEVNVDCKDSYRKRHQYNLLIDLSKQKDLPYVLNPIDSVMRELKDIKEFIRALFL